MKTKIKTAKNEKTEKTKRTGKTESGGKTVSSLSVITAAAAAVLFLLLFYVVLYKTGIVKLPGFVMELLNIESSAPEEIIPGDDGRIYEALEGRGQNDSTVTVEYDMELFDMRQLMQKTQPKNEYTMFFDIVYISGEKSSTKTVKLWRKNEKYRIEFSVSGQQTETVICDGERVYYYDWQTGGSRWYETSDSFTPESIAGIPDINDFFYDREITEPDITFARTQTDNVFKLTYSYPELMQTETLYVSLDYGIVVKAESSVAGKTAFSLSAFYISQKLDQSTLDDDKLFSAM